MFKFLIWVWLLDQVAVKDFKVLTNVATHSITRVSHQIGQRLKALIYVAATFSSDVQIKNWSTHLTLNRLISSLQLTQAQQIEQSWKLKCKKLSLYLAQTYHKVIKQPTSKLWAKLQRLLKKYLQQVISRNLIIKNPALYLELKSKKTRKPRLKQLFQIKQIRMC